MLSQDIIQVYRNSSNEAVIVVGRFKGIGNDVELESLSIPYHEIHAVANALFQVGEEIEQELI